MGIVYRSTGIFLLIIIMLLSISLLLIMNMMLSKIILLLNTGQLSIYSKLFSNAYSLDLLISYLNKNNTLVKTVISDDNYTRVYQHNITSYSSQGFPLKEKNLTDSTVFEYY